MVDPANPPAPVAPPTPPPAGDPPAPAPTPAAAPPGARTAAEIELELVKTQLASKNKDADLHKLKEENKRKDEQLAASRQALKAAGVIEGDGEPDAKSIVAKQEKDARAKERSETAKERAALRKLMATGLGEEEADLILGKVLRDPRITFDEATGTVSGLDEVFAALKPTIERLAGKPGATPPAAAPPAPPAPANAGVPMDQEWVAVKTGRDFMALPASKQEAFEKKYPEVARRLEAEFRAAMQKGRPITLAPVQAVR